MAYRHILVPYDHSPLAQAALSRGAWLAWRGGGELDLVRAVSTKAFTRRPFPDTARLQTQALEEEVAAAKTELSLQAARIREKGVSATGGAFPGEPKPVLLDYIERFGIDLVVMGTHGRPLAERWLLGSVASDLARQSPVPVLLVPREVEPAHDDVLRIMVALDGSALAETVLQAALDLADTVPADITLFEVLPGAGPSSDQKTPEWYEEPVVGAGRYLEDVQERIGERGVNVHRAYSAGAAGDEVVLFAERGRFDVVAVGTRGLTGVPRLVWGSVADQVVRQAHVPVLVTSRSTSSVQESVASDDEKPSATRRIREPAAPRQMRYLG